MLHFFMPPKIILFYLQINKPHFSPKGTEIYLYLTLNDKTKTELCQKASKSIDFSTATNVLLLCS